jgi:heme/copper-type cytochrome/quinol oxidase subunit 2
VAALDTSNGECDARVVGSSDFLDSRDPRTRRLSAVVYAVATGAAVAAWFLEGGWDQVGQSNWAGALAFVVVSVLVWWLVAGLGLRLVRRLDRTGNQGSSSADVAQGT